MYRSGSDNYSGLHLIMLAVLIWTVLLAVGVWSALQRWLGAGAMQSWLGAGIVLACGFSFLGVWKLFLLRRDRSSRKRGGQSTTGPDDSR